MNLQDWREQKKTGEAFTLPSGLEIQVRAVTVMDLAAQGKIPQTLMPMIDEAFAGGKAVRPTMGTMAEYVELMNVICRACIVSPIELDVSELDYADLESVTTWSSEATQRLKTFRREPAQPVGIGRNGTKVRAKTKQLSGVGAG